MKQPEAGFQPVLGLFIASIAFLVGSIGWYIHKTSQKVETLGASTKAIQDGSAISKTASKAHTMEKYLFTADYTILTPDKKLVVNRSEEKGDKGKAYTVDEADIGKLHGGFVTHNWQSQDDQESGPLGFTVFDDCKPHGLVDNRVELYRANGICVELQGYKAYGTDPAASLVIQKRFEHNKYTAGVEFQHEPVAAKSSSQTDISDALTEAEKQQYIKFAQSITEL